MSNPGDLLAQCTFDKRSASATFSVVVYLFYALCMLSRHAHTAVPISATGIVKYA